MASSSHSPHRDVLSSEVIESEFFGEFLCPFCNAPYSKEMLVAFETTCYADTCDMVEVNIRCDSCGRAIYVMDDFSSDVESTIKWVKPGDMASALNIRRETTDAVELRRGD